MVIWMKQVIFRFAYKSHICDTQMSHISLHLSPQIFAECRNFLQLSPFHLWSCLHDYIIFFLLLWPFELLKGQEKKSCCQHKDTSVTGLIWLILFTILFSLISIRKWLLFGVEVKYVCLEQWVWEARWECAECRSANHNLILLLVILILCGYSLESFVF